MMKKGLLLCAVALMTAMSLQAQKIQIVDNDGNGIPLVSVLTEDGTYIGTTDLNGVLADVKGAAKVTVTHVAYKPQLVTVTELPSHEGQGQGTVRRITMEDIDYGLGEVVVMPRPYLYVEYYFRAFSYIDDSLRVYTAGILPVSYDIQNNYKSKVRGSWAFGGAANKALTWNTQNLHYYAEEGVKSGTSPVETALRKDKRYEEKYKTSVEPDGENRWLVKNPEGVMGQILHDDGLSIATLDAGRMQIYAGKVSGNKNNVKMAQRRENLNYTYQYTEVFKLDEDGAVQRDGFVMEQDHWVHDSDKGKKITIIYLYATDKGYMDEAEVKARGKEISKPYAGDMTLDELAAYEHAHNIPALSPEQQKAIQTLTKQTGKKK
jgi:hypothetical protein